DRSRVENSLGRKEAPDSPPQRRVIVGVLTVHQDGSPLGRDDASCQANELLRALRCHGDDRVHSSPEPQIRSQDLGSSHFGQLDAIHAAPIPTAKSMRSPKAEMSDGPSPSTPLRTSGPTTRATNTRRPCRGLTCDEKRATAPKAIPNSNEYTTTPPKTDTGG